MPALLAVFVNDHGCHSFSRIGWEMATDHCWHLSIAGPLHKQPNIGALPRLHTRLDRHQHIDIIVPDHDKNKKNQQSLDRWGRSA
jgi:hypothetical protein